MRVPMIAGNWKMNTTVSEAVKLAGDYGPNWTQWICRKSRLSAICLIVLGQGNLEGQLRQTGRPEYVFWREGSLYRWGLTVDAGGLCEYVILGHSERRQYFGETNEIINKKVRAALKVGIKPILCVGESLAQYEAGKTEAVVTDHVTGSLKDIPASASLVIAYEPVWAIGTGKAATSEQANKIIGIVRRL